LTFEPIREKNVRMTPPTRTSPTDLESIKLSQPAHRALAGAGIHTLAQLARRSEAELLALHGFGPKAITLLKPALKAKGLSFKALPAKAPAAKAQATKATAAKTKTAKATAAKSATQVATPAGDSEASRQITAYIASLGDWKGKVLSRVRELVRAAVPGIVEDWKWGTPVWSLKGNVVAGGVFKDHVKLNFFKGASLSDPKGLFNAGLEAKGSRGIDLHEGDSLNEPALIELLKSAAAYNAGK
jgi:hypothetical protein